MYSLSNNISYSNIREFNQNLEKFLIEDSCITIDKTGNVNLGRISHLYAKMRAWYGQDIDTSHDREFEFRVLQILEYGSKKGWLKDEKTVDLVQKVIQKILQRDEVAMKNTHEELNQIIDSIAQKVIPDLASLQLSRAYSHRCQLLNPTLLWKSSRFYITVGSLIALGLYLTYNKLKNNGGLEGPENSLCEGAVFNNEHDKEGFNYCKSLAKSILREFPPEVNIKTVESALKLTSYTKDPFERTTILNALARLNDMERKNLVDPAITLIEHVRAMSNQNILTTTNVNPIYSILDTLQSVDVLDRLNIISCIKKLKFTSLFDLRNLIREISSLSNQEREEFIDTILKFDVSGYFEIHDLMHIFSGIPKDERKQIVDLTQKIYDKTGKANAMISTIASTLNAYFQDYKETFAQCVIDQPKDESLENILYLICSNKDMLKSISLDR